MSTQTTAHDTAVHNFDSLAYVGTDPLPRDRLASKHLHEPRHITTTIDPITGRDIGELQGKPFITDGNITIYFESKDTRQAYLDMPTDHPVKLPDNPLEDWVAEG